MQDGWNTHEKLVLHELERLNQSVKEIDEKCDRMHTDLVMLKAKAKVWGAIMGFVVTTAISIIEIFYKHHS